MDIRYIPVGETHFKGCWKYHGNCAIKKIEELLKFLSFLKKPVSAEVFIKILEG